VQSLGAIPFDLVKFRAFSSLFIPSSFSSKLRQRVLTKQAVAAKMVVAVLIFEISVLGS